MTSGRPGKVRFNTIDKYIFINNKNLFINKSDLRRCVLSQSILTKLNSGREPTFWEKALALDLIALTLSRAHDDFPIVCADGGMAVPIGVFLAAFPDFYSLVKSCEEPTLFLPHLQTKDVWRTMWSKITAGIQDEVLTFLCSSLSFLSFLSFLPFLSFLSFLSSS